MLRTMLQAMRHWLASWTMSRGTFGAHIVCEQGGLHKDSGTPNQDTAFALIKDVQNASGNKSARSTRRVARDCSLMLAGVFDGHGKDGHTLSKRAADCMETALCENLLNAGVGGLPGEAGLDVVGITKEVFGRVQECVCESGMAVNSGTTASMVLVRDGFAHVAWVGDSMIVMIADDAHGEAAHVRFVSSMHRTTDREEARRVEQNGGIMIEGYVVDKQGTHGIALTRTIGDLDMRQYGCIPTPQVTTLELRREDSVIVLASDGLWDSSGLSAEMIVRIASRKRGRCAKRICQQLMDAVVAGNGPSDDCTIVCLTLH